MNHLSPVYATPSYYLDIRLAAHKQASAHGRLWETISSFGQFLAHLAEKIYQLFDNLFFKIGEFFHHLLYNNRSSQELAHDFTSRYATLAPPPNSPASVPVSNANFSFSPDSSASVPGSDAASTNAVLFQPRRPIAINPRGLSRVPRTISQEEIEQDLTAANAQVTNLNELTTICQALSPNVESRIRHFIRFAITGNQSEYFLTLRSYFKGIIIEMRKESIPVELKALVLHNIANGYYGCNAIRIHSVEREYKRLSRRLPTSEDKILEALQQYKEQIFINHYGLAHNPSFLNHIRREVGAELGLDRHPLYINDPQIENGPRRSSSEYRDVFRNAFTSDAILNQMHAAINDLFRSPDYGAELGHYINKRLDELEARGQINHEKREELGDELMPWGYQISESGVKFLLLQVGAFVHR